MSRAKTPTLISENVLSSASASLLSRQATLAAPRIGRIEGVRYAELAPMLLNEVQKQRARLDAQQSTLQDLKEEVVQLKKINAAMQAAIVQVRSKDQLVAER